MQHVRSTTDLGAAIRAARKAHGMRQPDLAAACGTSVRFVVELERGKSTAQVGKVLHVLHMLGLRVSLTAADPR